MKQKSKFQKTVDIVMLIVIITFALSFFSIIMSKSSHGATTQKITWQDEMHNAFRTYFSNDDFTDMGLDLAEYKLRKEINRILLFHKLNINNQKIKQKIEMIFNDERIFSEVFKDSKNN